LTDKKKMFGRGLLAVLSLATLGVSLAGCVAYVPGPRRVAYVAPAPVVVVRPYRIYVP
jgi:hypothetical protein